MSEKEVEPPCIAPLVESSQQQVGPSGPGDVRTDQAWPLISWRSSMLSRGQTDQLAQQHAVLSFALQFAPEHHHLQPLMSPTKPSTPGGMGHTPTSSHITVLLAGAVHAAQRERQPITCF